VSDMPTVVACIANAMQDLRSVEKSGVNQQQGYAFRKTDDVLTAVAPVLRRHRLVVVPVVEDVSYAEVEIGAKRTPMISVRLLTRFDWYGPNGDMISARVASEGQDSADKAAAKASTVALRTVLVQVLALPTADSAALSPGQLKAIQTLMREAGITEREDRLAFASEVVGRELDSSKDLTGAEASEVIAALKAGIDEAKEEAPA